MSALLFLFLVVPAVELALLIEVGRRIGTGPTLALIVLTGVCGASLARHQGLNVIRQVERETALGHLPGEALIDGLLILLAAALLITPGLLTDTVGFLVLIPGTRAIVKDVVRRRLAQHIQEGTVHFTMYSSSPPPQGDVYDVTPEDGPPPRPSLPSDRHD